MHCMHHKLLTRRALFCIGVNAKGHAESAFRDTCRTSGLTIILLVTKHTPAIAPSPMPASVKMT